MPVQDDPGRSAGRDPFDFREPPAPLRETPPPLPGPSHSPFDFHQGGRAERGRLARLVRRRGAPEPHHTTSPFSFSAPRSPPGYAVHRWVLLAALVVAVLALLVVVVLASV